MKTIVIGQRGWVWVGDVEREGEELVISDCACIRVWGTTQGLGELRNGPLPRTVLDPQGTTRAHVLAVVATIACDGWEGATIPKGRR